MADLDDKDLAAIREMQRVRGPSVKNMIVSLAVHGPTVLIAVLGVGLGLYAGRMRLVGGALVLALAWGVGASRSWDAAVHRRQQQLWLRVAGTCIVLGAALAVTLFFALDVRGRLFGYPLSDATVAAVRQTLDEHAALIARRTERFERVGRLRQRLGPRPDLGPCPDSSGVADELPRSADDRMERVWQESPHNVSVIFPSGVPVFDEVSTDDLVQELEAQLTLAAPEPVDEARLVDAAARLNTQPERLRFLVVDEYVPPVRLSDGHATGAELHGTVFTLGVDDTQPSCAAYVDAHGPLGSTLGEFAQGVARAVDEAPYFRVGEALDQAPTLDAPRVLLASDMTMPLPNNGQVSVPDTGAHVEIASQLTYTGLGFSLQYPSHLALSDATPQQTVELLDTDGSSLRVARGDCEALNAAHAQMLAALHDGGQPRQATRMLGRARVRGVAATGAPGTLELYLHEAPATVTTVPPGRADGPAARGTDAEDEAAGTVCTLAFVETERPMPPTWVATALASLQEEPHPSVPLAELVAGETRTPLVLGEALTVPDTTAQVSIAWNPARMAWLGALQVRIPPGAFARVSGGSGNETALRVVEGPLELHLRIARAPSSGWPSSEARLQHASLDGAATAPLTLLGEARVGVRVPTPSGEQRVYAFDYAGHLLELTVSPAEGQREADVDAWVRRIVDSAIRTPAERAGSTTTNGAASAPPPTARPGGGSPGQ